MRNEMLKPLPRFLMTIGCLPTSYLVSMTYEEQLLWLCNYINTIVIPNINDNKDAINKLKEYVEELKKYVDDYFDNLDIQQEIDNTLNEMALDGRLENIISQFLELASTFAYNTVSEMKIATSLVDGSYAKTYGFHSVNDGGGAYYRIRQKTSQDNPDEKLIIALNDPNLVAELLYYKTINIGQLGFANNGSEDIGAMVNSLINSTNIYIPYGTYLISTPIEVNRDYTVINCDGTLKIENNNGLNVNACECKINIHKIQGTHNHGTALRMFSTTNDSHSMWNNNVCIDIIEGCEYGILLNPVYKGCQYNKFTFNEINCTYDIVFNASDGGWVNENTFNGGRLSGTYGVYMIKGENIGDYYNGNKFLNVGYENITNPIVLQYAIRNTFQHSRMSESLNGTYWIQCDADSRLNNFQNDSSLHFDKVNDLNTALTSRNTYKAYPLIWNGHYYGYEGYVIGGKKCLNDRPVEPTTPTTMGYGYTGEYSTDVYYNGMLVNVGCDSNGTANLTLPSVFSNAGITNFLLRVSYRGQNGTITVKDINNNTIIDNTIIGDDQYVTNRIFRVTMNYNGITPLWIVERIVN